MVSIGTTIPMYCSGVGKAILATMPREEIEEIWKSSNIEKNTLTITRFENLLSVLDEVKSKGYACG